MKRSIWHCVRESDYFERLRKLARLRQGRLSYVSFVFAVAVLTVLRGQAFGQTISPRITQQINGQERVAIAGSHPPMARFEQDSGRVPSGTRLQGMSIVLSRTAQQEADLQTLLASQHDPSSPLYHKWLTPDEFAARFGIADVDIDKVESWLQQQGFSVDGVARSKNRITFSGTVGQVESAFGAELHNYKSGTATNFAPSSDITIPAALSSVVQSVSNLSSFRPKPHVKFRTGQTAVKANFTSSQSGSHYLTPKDIATIYNINPAYNSAYTGAGQSIAVVGQSSIVLSDIEKFQKAAGLTVRDPTLVLVPNSGSSATSSGDQAESDLDLEYTGGIATGATIYFVYTGNNQNYNVFDSIEYAVDTRIAPIISVSYGSCETQLSSTDYTSLNGILAQAASQGQTVVAASGDSGSTDCYEATSFTTSQRQALTVDFPASSQYVTGMGGTEFSSSDVSSSNTTYWQSASGSDVTGSALSYIPEQVWNDSSSSNGLSAGGGGTSTLTARPSWQTGVAGISSGNYRLVPDISLESSSLNAGYLYCSSDSNSTGVTGSCSNGFRDSNNTYLTVAGGTSFGSPIFAGMLAIINQKLNSTGQGVVNSTLYTLAANSSTYASAFHDIKNGSNACIAGSSYCSGNATSQYAATTGYDQATGLGSVDFYNLLSAWPTSNSSASLASSTTTLSAATASPSSGASDVITIKVASGSSSVSSTPTGTVSVAVDGTTVNSALALSNGSATYTFSSTTSGSHVITATYSGNAALAASTGAVTITIASSSSGSGGSGGSGSTTVTVTPSGGYTGTVTLSLSTSSSYIQQYACYELSDAVVTGTSPVSQTLTFYAGAASCATAQSKGRQVHSIRGASTSSSNSRLEEHGMAWSVADAALISFVGLRRRFNKMFFIVIASIIGLGLSGCGSGGSSASSSKSFSVSVSPSTVTVSAETSGIPTGSYSLTITGEDSSSSSSSASTTMTLAVN